MFQCRDIGIREDRDPVRARYCLDQNVLSLAVELGRHEADTCNIPTRLGQRCCKTSSDHIFGHDDQGNGLCRLLKLLRNEIPRDHDCVWRGPDYCWHHCGGLLVVESEAVRYELEDLAFTKTVDALFIDEDRRGRFIAIGSSCDGEVIDATRFLCSCAERRRQRCAAHNTDEVAPSHCHPRG